MIVQSIIYKKCNFSDNNKVINQSRWIDPLNIIKRNQFKTCILWIKYLQKPHQKFGLERVLDTLINKGLSPVNIIIKYYDIEKTKYIIKELQAIEIYKNVKWIPKDNSEKNLRAIQFYKLQDESPKLTIHCDRDFNDIGNVKTNLTKEAHFIYIKDMTQSFEDHTWKLDWKEGLAIKISDGRTEYTWKTILSNISKNYENFVHSDVVFNFLHINWNTQITELQNLINCLQNKFPNKIKSIHIRTLKESSKFKYADQKLTNQDKLDLDDKTETEIRKGLGITNNGKNTLFPNIQISLRYITKRTDTHLNYIEFLSRDNKSTEDTLKLISDEGVQIHQRDESERPVELQLTRPHMILILYANKDQNEDDDGWTTVKKYKRSF